MLPRLLVSLFAVAGASTLACTAFADVTPGERARADALFEEAKSLMAQSRFLEACPKLIEARRIEPRAGGTVLALALCYEGQEKLATAMALLREARRMAQESRNADREALAREHVDALVPRVSKIVIRGRERASSVTVDGAPVGADGTVEVDGGEHVVRAEIAGAPAWEQRVDVATKDDARSVEIPVAPKAPAPIATPPAVVERPGATSSTRPAAYVVGGAGVAATLVGAYFGVRALGAQADSRDLCPSSPCANAQAVSRHADAQHAAVAADVGVGVGVAAIAAGVVLLVLDRRGRTPAAWVAPSVHDHAAGWVVVGRF